jgi:hypothetical protein
MDIDLIRVESTPESGTFGTLLAHSQIVCLTLELPWRDNARGNSCIPPGHYRLLKRDMWSRRSKLGYTWEIICPPRTAILWHPANLSTQLEGCIAPGHRIGELDGQRAILDSTSAFRKVKAILQGTTEHWIHISNHLTSY